ncbi:MAG TPA: sugar ABC transporter permease [Symbiobacteriaceae bacterium]|nr:sugar ABC transporter permease [Symbiobacteriaceae bacterium]
MSQAPVSLKGRPTGPGTGRQVQAESTLTRLGRGAMPFLFVAPTLLLISAVVFYPIFNTFLMSLSHVNSVAQPTGFAGLQHYTELFRTPLFWRVLGQTAVWTGLVVGITTTIAMPVALALNMQFPGRRIARAVLIIPWAASLTINAIIWRWILDGQYSIITALLMRLGWIEEPIVWLGTPAEAWVAIIFVGILVSIPFTSFSLLAGLQSIPGELYEAARVDGAGFWLGFRHITLPMMRQALTVTTLMNVIYVFNSFPIIWVLTEGGPAYRTDILITYLYKEAFRNGRFGPASAMAMITFLILLAFSLGFTRLTAERERREDYGGSQAQG